MIGVFLLVRLAAATRLLDGQTIEKAMLDVAASVRYLPLFVT